MSQISFKHNSIAYCILFKSVELELEKRDILKHIKTIQVDVNGVGALNLEKRDIYEINDDGISLDMYFAFGNRHDPDAFSLDLYFDEGYTVNSDGETIDAKCLSSQIQICNHDDLKNYLDCVKTTIDSCKSPIAHDKMSLR